MTAPLVGDRQPQTVRTPARVWFGPRSQVRFELVECNGESSVRASQWALKPAGWHPEHGVSVSSWGELLTLISALCRSWFVVFFHGAP